MTFYNDSRRVNLSSYDTQTTTPGVVLDYYICNLSESERDVVVKKLELIKDKFYDNLNIQYSMVKGKDNWVKVENNVDLAIGLKLYEMIHSISMGIINERRVS